MNVEVILVDNKDVQVGTMSKLESHQKGILHRAFSVFIFNSKGEMLLQKRAAGKYHSPDLWSNACCSHPVTGETISETVQRRLREEMGLHCPVEFAFCFRYHAPFDNGLIENELDHVFIAVSDETPVPDKNEVSDWKYRDIDSLRTEVKYQNESFTEWFQIVYEEVTEYAGRMING